MTAQTLTQISHTRSLFDFALVADDIPSQPDVFSAAEFGYEICEGDLTNAMTATLTGELIEDPVPQVSPEEFESIYTWFIS